VQVPNENIEKAEQGSFRRFIAIGKETTSSSCRNGNSDFILGKNLLTMRIASMLEELPGEVSHPWRC